MATEEQSTRRSLEGAIRRAALAALEPGAHLAFAKEVQSEFLLAVQSISSAIGDLGRVSEVLGPDLDLGRMITHLGHALSFAEGVNVALLERVERAEDAAHCRVLDHLEQVEKVVGTGVFKGQSGTFADRLEKVERLARREVAS